MMRAAIAHYSSIAAHNHVRVPSPQPEAASAEPSDVPTNSSFSVSVMRVGGRREPILVWDEKEYDFNIDGTNA
jgi:hypothetical protein